MKIKTLGLSHSNINSRKAKIPIYSISAHPTLYKVATAGQDYKIKIWNTKNILSMTGQSESSGHDQGVNDQDRLLTTLSMHEGSVLVVRWSVDGEFLASGADDSKVIIWKYDDSAFGGFGERNKENYRSVRILTGHESEVADLAWSPNQQFLASCGFDYKIFVYDASTFDRITRIDAHSGFVKGLTWDPAGQFLAAQSDDRTVKIYRTSDWKVEKEVSAPYQTGSATTVFRRISWSPDGSAIATVDGENNGICVAPVIYREDWQSSVCLVGHEGPVEVAAFNPHLFTLTDAKTNVQTQTSVLALGSQDNGVSIWWTGSARAICSIRDLFTHTILDLSWTADGLGLYACSYDGTIAYLQFEPSDFGSRVSTTDKESKLQKYGRVRRDIIPESSTILQMERKLLDKEGLEGRMDDGHFDVQEGFEQPKPLAASRPPIRPTLVPVTGQSTASQQDVTTNKDGKKRIRPVLVQQSTPLLDSPSKQTSRTSQPLKSTDAIKRTRTTSSSGEVINATFTLPLLQSLPKSQNVLSIPSPKTFFSIQCMRGPFLDAVEFKNNANGCLVVATRAGEQVWTSTVKNAALSAVITPWFMAVAYVDCTLHIHTVSGRKAMVVKMASAASFLSSCEELLVYVDCIGNVNVWNVKEMKCVLAISLVPLLDQAISNVVLRGDQVVVMASGGKEFLWNDDMKAWVCLAPVLVGGMAKMPKMDEIEMQLNGAVQSRNPKSVVYWLKIYARKLTDEDSHAKAKELCADLNTTGTLGGMIKKELLKLILPILIKNRAFQGFLVDLADLTSDQMDHLN